MLSEAVAVRREDEVGARFLAKWEHCSNIRTASRFRPEVDFRVSEILSDAMVPFINHPILSTADEEVRDALKLQSCYAVLEDLARGEAEVVGVVCTELALHQAGSLLPRPARQALLAIAVDESYHALAAREIIEDLEKITGIESQVQDRPLAEANPVRGLITRCLALCRPNQAPALKIACLTLIENAVTDELLELMRGSDANSPFYLFNREHLRDEARHRAYFRSLLTQVWAGLSQRDRDAIGAALMVFIAGYLEQVTRADVSANRRQLLAMGFNDSQAREVLKMPESQRLPVAQNPLWPNLLACLGHCGLLADPSFRCSLSQEGWLQGEMAA